jgi:hypothetical protein
MRRDRRVAAMPGPETMGKGIRGTLADLLTGFLPSHLTERACLATPLVVLLKVLIAMTLRPKLLRAGHRSPHDRDEEVEALQREP